MSALLQIKRGSQTVAVVHDYRGTLELATEDEQIKEVWSRIAVHGVRCISGGSSNGMDYTTQETKPLTRDTLGDAVAIICEELGLDPAEPTREEA